MSMATEAVGERMASFLYQRDDRRSADESNSK